MWFKIINNKKFLLIFIFVLLYLALNLFDGERGLISYFDKKQILNNLKEEEKNLSQELDIVEKKNELLSVNLDKDFIETLIRQKLKFGKSTEKVYLIQKEND
jgi:cell division protein FtsB